MGGLTFIKIITEVANTYSILFFDKIMLESVTSSILFPDYAPTLEV